MSTICVFSLLSVAVHSTLVHADLPRVSPATGTGALPAATVPPPTAFSPLLEGAVLELQVEFEAASDSLSNPGLDTVDRLAVLLATQPELRAEITGHTDAQGGDDLNLWLSRHRAQAVAGRLAENGISLERLTARGAGAREPVATNQSAAGRHRNRRVEIRVMRTDAAGRQPASDVGPAAG